MYFGSSLVKNLKTVQPTAISIFMWTSWKWDCLKCQIMLFIIRPLSSLRSEKRSPWITVIRENPGQEQEKFTGNRRICPHGSTPLTWTQIHMNVAYLGIMQKPCLLSCLSGSVEWCNEWAGRAPSFSVCWLSPSLAFPCHPPSPTLLLIVAYLPVYPCLDT